MSEQILQIIQGSCFITLVLFIWFKTDAFVQYVKFFKLSWAFYVWEYNEYRKILPTVDYREFLSIRHPSFLANLLNCEICLSVWLGFVASFYIGFANGIVANIGGLILYYFLLILRANKKGEKIQ